MQINLILIRLFLSLYFYKLEIWTVEEDEQLRQLVENHGTGNWTLIAESLPDRTGKQCRERWHNHLGEGIKKGEWTEQVIIFVCLRSLYFFTTPR